MERLTAENGQLLACGLGDCNDEPNTICSDCHYKEHAMERLAKYEGTGLTPEEITDGKTLAGWISVDERLPKVDVDTYCDLMAYTDLGYTIITKYIRTHGFKPWQEVGKVTHWMPLPEPPKEETNG